MPTLASLMLSSPDFPVFVDVWRSSHGHVQRMTFDERGRYFEMLLEQWEAGSAPGTPTACAEELGGTVADWCRAWPKLRPCFESTGE